MTARAEEAPGADEGEVLYCYGLVPPGAPPPPEALRGVADRRVERLGLGFCDAVISRVPAAEYRAEAVERRLGDLEWVGEQGMGHERVVTWFVDEAWILPLRLLTLYSSAEALREEMAGREAEIRDALDRMEGRYEWDLKVSYDADRLAGNMSELSEEVAELEEEAAASSPGRGYLLERARSEKVREGTADAARRAAEELLEGLRGHADEVARLELARRGEELPVVLGAALLVPAERAEALQAEVDRRAERLEALGVHVGFSGPWAPYRFVGEDDERGVAGG